MSRSASTETVEEFLARGGVIQQIEQGESGDPMLKFNNVPLHERIARQKRKTWKASQGTRVPR